MLLGLGRLQIALAERVVLASAGPTFNDDTCVLEKVDEADLQPLEWEP